MNFLSCNQPFDNQNLRKFPFNLIIAFLIQLLFLTNFASAQKTIQPDTESKKSAKVRKMETPKVSLVYSDDYILKIDLLVMALKQVGLNHPFDYKKYKKIKKQLVKDKLVRPEQFHAPKPLTDDQILLVQTEQFLKNIEDTKTVLHYLEVNIPEQTKIMGVPISKFLKRIDFKKKVMTPFRTNAGGTILAAEKAMESGIGINLGGGFHHAKPKKGEGFCIFADVPIAIRQLQKDKRIKKALIIDVDAHKGNGTAYCLANDPTTFTFSMHEKNIYPMGDGKSDLDIDLKSGIQDEEYLKTLKDSLPKIFKESKPDIVFIVAGCDTLQNDPLTNCKMTVEGICKRDLMIIDYAVKEKIPVVMTLSGGYSPEAWKCQYESIKRILKKYPAK